MCRTKSDRLRPVQAFFNVMLRELGVQGLKIQEVYGVEAELLAMVPCVAGVRRGHGLWTDERVAANRSTA